MARLRKSKAEAGIAALRRRLAAEHADFAAAADAEAEGERFCAAIRRELQAVRRDRKLQQEDVAKRLNLTQSAISKIETGQGDIGLRTLHRYARALGLRPVMTLVPEEEAEAAEAVQEDSAATVERA